jgi:hypothetical protein
MAQTAQDEMVRGAGHGVGAVGRERTGGITQHIEHMWLIAHMSGIAPIHMPRHMTLPCGIMPTSSATFTPAPT